MYEVGAAATPEGQVESTTLYKVLQDLWLDTMARVDIYCKLVAGGRNESEFDCKQFHVPNAAKPCTNRYLDRHDPTVRGWICQFDIPTRSNCRFLRRRQVSSAHRPQRCPVWWCRSRSDLGGAMGRKFTRWNVPLRSSSLARGCTKTQVLTYGLLIGDVGSRQRQISRLVAPNGRLRGHRRR